jgi:hypothetical protein
MNRPTPTTASPHQFTRKLNNMKTIFTFLMLPLIVLICFFNTKLYISGQYAAAYTLVAA